MDKSKIFKAVQKQLSKGNIDKAISLWEEYVKDNPDGNIYNTIGDLYLRKGDKKNAVEYFHKAASMFVKEGFSTKAQALYKKILHVNPNDAKALTLTGDLYSEKGLLHEAAKFYLASIEALAKENRRDEIAEACQKIIDLAPDNTSLRSKLAQYLHKEGFIEEASREYMLIGKIFLERSDDENALQFLEKAYEIYPRNKEVYPLLINFYLNTGERDKAEALLRQATDLFPDDIDLQLSRAEILKDESNYNEALEIVNAVLSTGSLEEETEINALKLRAELFKHLDNTDQAIDDLLEVSEKLIHQQRYQEAEEVLLKAKDVSPERALEALVELYSSTEQNSKAAQSLVELADIKASSGLQEEASQLYQRAAALAPEDETIKAKLTEMEPEITQEEVPSEEETTPEVEEKEEKTLSEKLLDADIYIRYGLTNEAIDLLEKLKVEDPQNVEIHTRLKNLYLEINDKEKAIAECLALARLMETKGDIQEKEKYISEALEIDPSDPRLSEFSRQTADSGTGTTTEEFLGTSIQGLEGIETEEAPEPQVQEQPAPEPEPTIEAPPQEEPTEVVDYSEELSEAEFYYKQGLYEDALSIYDKLSKLYPDDESIKERIAEVQQAMAGQQETQEAFAPAEEIEPAQEPELTPSLEIPEETTEEVSEETPAPAASAEDTAAEELFQNIFSSDEIKTIIEEEPSKAEPELEEDVFEIFEEFKKGISQEVSEEDYETHYNLGIAYKEMGLIDDAIKEFQVARNSPERKVHVLSMLGLCYMEKGLYSLAAETFEEALKNTKEQDETFWSIKFDLAESYEKMGEKDKALALYTEIYGWDSKFRGVDEKINTLKGKGPQVVLEEKEEKQPKDKKKSSKKSKISYI